MFVDVVKISIEAGKGGDGAVAFRREKYVPNGGPAGGDGGKGGDIIFKADKNLSTLLEFRYKKVYKAKNGENGGNKRCSGKSGEDLVLYVPFGTLLYDDETGALLADISDDDPFIAAKGGNGGFGNQHFATPTRQAPRFAKPGLPGEKYTLRLELKLLADVGLIGYPNVGKSTLLAAVSAARPKIGNYHFTTLTPNLGIVKVSESQSFVMADIPGLIEGADKGAGLGHTFLRHIERCRLLLHMVDVSGSEGRDAVHDFKVIRRQLAGYSPQLAKLPQWVVANKSDAADKSQIEKFQMFIKTLNLPFYQISAVTHEGVAPLIKHLASALESMPPVKRFTPKPQNVRTKTQSSAENPCTIEKKNGVFYIDAPRLIPLLKRADMEDYESLQYFQRRLWDDGIIARLKELNVQEGDLINIGGWEFEYKD